MSTSIRATFHTKRFRFFRVRLLSLDPEGIRKLLKGYEEQVRAIRANALTMSWYMRGGVTYEDILNMSQHEREAINKLIDDHLETTKKTQLPFF